MAIIKGTYEDLVALSMAQVVQPVDGVNMLFKVIQLGDGWAYAEVDPSLNHEFDVVLSVPQHCEMCKTVTDDLVDGYCSECMTE